VEGKPVKLRGFMVDISNRKQAERDLKEALEEKELLMQELNHRIKNNLSMITSLIGLKEMETENDLSDIMHQIDAIRIIHEKLYQSESITSIEAGGYFGELLETVFASFSSQPVKLVNTTADVQVPTAVAAALGLIVNEIATNAIKYGFNDGEKAVFRVHMSAEKATNRYVLTLSNTGRPFPEDKDLDNPGTLGLQLISTLVDQLDGEIELQRSPHPLFTISFPM
jgi:two-component sensor histidine kinase